MSTHDEFLLKDYESNSLLLGTYISMRLAVVAGFIPLLGFLISQTSGTTPARFGILGLILLVATSMIRIVGAVNRNIYVRCLHLAWVEHELHEFGFYSYWSTYAKRRSQDTSGHAFVIACRVINIGICGYALEQLSKSRTEMVASFFIAGIVVAVTNFLANELYIYRNLHEGGFLMRMEADLEIARKNAVKPMILT